MSKIICPECKSVINFLSDTCPKCGFPVQKTLITNKITDTEHIFICPKCAYIHFSSSIYPFPLPIKCEYCDSNIIQTNENNEELFNLSISTTTENEFAEQTISIAKKYGNNQFSEEAYNYRLQKLHKEVEELTFKREQSKQQQNVPKCPKCGSTAIMAGQRGFNLLTGFLGSNKTVNRCANCGHTWEPGK